MKRWARCVSLLPMLALSACVRLHAPDPFVLGERSISASAGAAGDPTTNAARLAAAPSESIGSADSVLGVPLHAADEEDWIRVRTASTRDSVKGVCVLMPGILGSHSSPTCERSLRTDGWHVVIVAPPLVSSVLAELRGADAGDPSDLADRGARVGRAVDAVVCRAAELARREVETLRSGDETLAGKPVIFVGESLGALLGVGVVATGRIDCDAALFVAGGGSLLDVAAESSIRRILFGDLPIDEPAFRDGFAAASRFDSLAAAASLRGCPVVCVTADIDVIVPTPAQEALWSALGRPPRYRFDGGHLELFVFAEWNIMPAVREVASRAVASLPSAP
jgi:hypothetical protein